MKLFILHGWTYQIATWNAVRTMLTERHIDYEFLPIPGLSDGTNPVWTLDDYVQWLEKKTATEDKVALWGHSNGGRISLAFTVKHPEKVARLILEDSAGIPPRGLSKLKRDVFKISAQILGRFIRFEKFRSVFRRAIRASDYANATPEMRKTMSNLVLADLGKVLDRITCPTLIVWGAQDKTTPLKDGELIHRGIKNSRLVVLPDARHSPHITHAQKMVELVEKELA